MITLAIALVLHVQGELDACQKQPSLQWCAGRSGKGVPVTVEVLRKYDNQVYRSMRFKVNDDFGSYADQVKAGRAFTGDCDNVVYTILDLLDRDGYDTTDMMRLAVSKARNGKIDHVVAVGQIDGKWWVFGEGKVYPASEAKWQTIMTAKVDSLKWHGVE